MLIIPWGNHSNHLYLMRKNYALMAFGLYQGTRVSLLLGKLLIK